MLSLKSISKGALEIVKDAFQKDDPICPGCSETLKGLPPMSVICRDCADSLADGITAGESGYNVEIGLSGRFVAIYVAPKAEIRSLALKLLEGDAHSRRALAAAYAHAVPISDYMLVDSVCMIEEDPSDDAVAPRAFARAVASAFQAAYRGSSAGEPVDWQAAAIARYSKGPKKSSPTSTYPVVVAGLTGHASLSELAARFRRTGAERMIVIEAPQRKDV